MIYEVIFTLLLIQSVNLNPIFNGYNPYSGTIFYTDCDDVVTSISYNSPPTMIVVNIPTGMKVINNPYYKIEKVCNSAEKKSKSDEKSSSSESLIE